ncbi:MAG: hypothetical protein IKJ36_04735, partial [Clostridia bacterium]|nr:hypothetical protein [Clostridia bacterium]
MKIIKKLLISAMLFLIYANNAYATTAGTYVAKENTGVNKIFLLLVGVGLISLVLFLGYKMDKNETSDERKSKTNKKERDLDDVYNAVYNSKTDISREIDKIEINEEDDIEIIDDDSIYEDDEESLITDELLAEELEKMAIEDAIKEAESKFKEVNVSEDEEEIDLSYEEVREDENNEVVKEVLPKETKVSQSTTVIIDDEDEEYIRNKKSMNSTMVFETEKLRKIEEKLNKVYEYEDDEDELDLTELESSIKAANIKRYTRKKPKEKKKE